MELESSRTTSINQGGTDMSSAFYGKINAISSRSTTWLGSEHSTKTPLLSLVV